MKTPNGATLSTALFSYSRATFTAEASTLQLQAIPSHLTLTSHTTGKQVEFRFTKHDLDASGEDIAGWNYQAITPGHERLRVLIIND